MERQNVKAPRLIRQMPQDILLLLLGILSIVTLLYVGAAAWLRGGDGAPFAHTETTAVESGWIDGEGNAVTLPITLVGHGERYQIETVLTAEDDDKQSLFFSAKYLNVRLFLDGKEVGSCLCRPEGRTETIGKTYTMFRLPENFSGSTLRIEAEPLLGSDCKYEIIAPRMGEEGALLYELVAGDSPLMVIAAIMSCFGMFLIACGIQSLRFLSKLGGGQTFQVNYLYVGLFAVLFAMYSISVSNTIHLFAANSYFIYLMEFLLLSLLPLPLLAMLSGFCTGKLRLAVMANSVAIFLNFILQAALHFTCGLEMRRGVFATHLLMVVSAAMVALVLLTAGLKRKRGWYLSLSFLPVLAGALIDIFRFYLPRPYQKAQGFQLGVLVFLLLQTIDLIQKSFDHYENSLKADTYRQMAYTDVLTGLASRTAFEEKIAQMKKPLRPCADVWCVAVDINNLKETNDACGHAQGDALIRTTANILQEAAGPDAPIYRTGGDEFNFFLFDQSEQAVCQLHDRIDGLLAAYNVAQEHPLSLAIGFDRLRTIEGDTLEKLISRTDALMYEDKRAEKVRRAGACAPAKEDEPI